jgi:rsbT co-antagonist protein RsbR
MPAPEIASPRWDTAELLQSAIDALPDPLFVKDREHRWIAVNDAFCRLIQRTRAELLGHSDPDFFPPEQVAVFWRLDDAILAGEPPNDNEEQIAVRLATLTLDLHRIVALTLVRTLPVSAASGLVRVGGVTHVIADDELHLAEPPRRRPRRSCSACSLATSPTTPRPQGH